MDNDIDLNIYTSHPSPSRTASHLNPFLEGQQYPIDNWAIFGFDPVGEQPSVFDFGTVGDQFNMRPLPKANQATSAMPVEAGAPANWNNFVFDSGKFVQPLGFRAEGGAAGKGLEREAKSPYGMLLNRAYKFNNKYTPFLFLLNFQQLFGNFTAQNLWSGQLKEPMN
ncbi:MAG: hypothetical protein Q9217_000707 [Psora testacea]